MCKIEATDVKQNQTFILCPYKTAHISAHVFSYEASGGSILMVIFLSNIFIQEHFHSRIKH